MPIGVVRQTPETRDLLHKVIEEALAVGQSRGVALPQDYAEDRIRFVDTLPPAMKASMLHDLEAGKPLEVRWLSGGIVDLGREVGIATPANEFVLAALAPLADGAADERQSDGGDRPRKSARSEEHTSELQSLMRSSNAVFC